MKKNALQFFLFLAVAQSFITYVFAQGEANWLISFENQTNKTVSFQVNNNPPKGSPAVWSDALYHWKYVVDNINRPQGSFILPAKKCVLAHDFPLPWRDPNIVNWVKNYGNPSLIVIVDQFERKYIVDEIYKKDFDGKRYVVVRDGNTLNILQEGEIGQNWELRILVSSDGSVKVLDKGGKVIDGSKAKWDRTAPLSISC